MAEEAADCERRIVGDPCLNDAIAEKIVSRRATSRRHVRDEDRRVRIRAAKAFDERRSGARLTERHGVDPQDSGRRDIAIPAVALADRLVIPRFASPAPRKAQWRERRRRIPQ